MDNKEEIFRKFGRQVAILRNQKKISVRELAEASSLDEMQVLRIESGEADVFFTTILALARALDVAPAELLQTL